MEGLPADQPVACRRTVGLLTAARLRLDQQNQRIKGSLGMSRNFCYGGVSAGCLCRPISASLSVAGIDIGCVHRLHNFPVAFCTLGT